MSNWGGYEDSVVHSVVHSECPACSFRPEGDGQHLLRWRKTTDDGYDLRLTCPECGYRRAIFRAAPRAPEEVQ